MWRLQDNLYCRSSLFTLFEIETLFVVLSCSCQVNWPMNLQGLSCLCLPQPHRSTKIAEANLCSALHTKTNNKTSILFNVCCGRNSSSFMTCDICDRQRHPAADFPYPVSRIWFLTVIPYQNRDSWRKKTKTNKQETDFSMGRRHSYVDRDMSKGHKNPA